MADSNTVDIYVELSGKENYHSSLKGRDEADQHPIAAITNLQTTLDDLDDKIDDTKTELSEDIDATQNLINNLDDRVTGDLATMNTRIDQISSSISGKTEELEEKINQLDSDIDQLDTELTARINDIQTTINAEMAQFKTEVNTKISTAIKYKGSVRKFEYLPTTGQEVGDMYNVEETDNNYFWTGLSWDSFAGDRGLENYATKEYVDGSIKTLNEAIDQELDSDYYNRTQVDDLLKEVMNFRGMLAHKSDLDVITPKAGYFYKVIENNQSYIGTGTQWIEICGAAETYTKEQIDALLALKADKTAVTEVSNKVTELSTKVTNLETNSATKEELKELKEEVEEELSKVFVYKGSVATYDDLPKTGNKIGDVWNVEDTGMNYAWDGTKWDNLGSIIDLKDYAKLTDLDPLKADILTNKNNIETINNTLLTKADKSELTGMLTNTNLGDTLKAGTGVELAHDTTTNTYTIGVTTEKIQPVVKEIVDEQIGEVKSDVQANTEAIQELDEQVEDLKWKKINDVLSST